METVEVVKVVPQEQNVDMPVPQVDEQTAEVPEDVKAAFLRHEKLIRDLQGKHSPCCQ